MNGKKITLGYIVYHLGKDGTEYLAEDENRRSFPLYDHGLHEAGKPSFHCDIGKAKLCCCEEEAKERAAAISAALPAGHQLKGHIFSGKLIIETSGK